MTEPRRLGPNARKLIAHKMSIDAIPQGGGLAAGIKFLSSKTAILAGAREATNWTATVIDLVRAAAEPNPWKDAGDEEIAAELLRRIDAKRKMMGG